MFEDEFVPGLGQAPEYARALISSFTPHVSDDVDVLLHIELAEATDDIRVRVLPINVGSRPALGRNFTILEFPDAADPDVIFAESVSYFVLEDEVDEVSGCVRQPVRDRT